MKKQQVAMIGGGAAGLMAACTAAERGFTVTVFEKMLNERNKRGLKNTFQTGQDVFRWWMEEDVLPGQMSVEDFV